MLAIVTSFMLINLPQYCESVCDPAWVPEPIFNGTDSTIKFTTSDPCWQNITRLKAEYDATVIEPLPYTEQDGEVIIQLTKIGLARNQPARITVGNINTDTHALDFVWPTFNTSGRFHMNVSSAEKYVSVTTNATERLSYTTVTLREDQQYNISCIVTTLYPIADYRIKIVIGCEDHTPTSSSQRAPDDVYGRQTYIHTAHIINYTILQPFAPIAVPIYCGGRWINSLKADFGLAELGALFTKYAVIYSKIYKPGCVTRSFDIEDGNDSWEMPQRHLLNGTTLIDEMENECKNNLKFQTEEYCAPEKCTSCLKYCHPKADYELKLKINVTAQTLNWSSFSYCFHTYTVYFCQLTGRCGNFTPVRATGDEVTYNFSKMFYAEQVYRLSVVLQNAKVDQQWIQDSIIFPRSHDVPSLSLKITTRSDTFTIDHNQRETVEVTSTEVVHISCQINAPDPIHQNIDMKLFIGCAQWNSTTWQKETMHFPNHTFYINADNLYVRSLQQPVQGYVPVMCSWQWKIDNLPSSDFTRISLFHFNITDMQHNMENASSEWRSYNDVNSDNFVSQCQEKLQEYHSARCEQKKCDRCELYQKPCLNNGKCDETHLACDCSEAIGYEGEQCNQPTEVCGQVFCVNGGLCAGIEAELMCICQEGYSGAACEIPDTCFPNPCRETWMFCQRASSLPDEIGYICKENEFISTQIKTNQPCNQTSLECNGKVTNSICHPRGFCYCPSGTILTRKTEGYLECLPDKVKCQTQLDCSWLSNKHGVMICIKDIAANDTGTCNCRNRKAIHPITGVCLPSASEQAVENNPANNFGSISKWWRYALAAAWMLIMVMGIVCVFVYAKRTCPVDDRFQRRPGQNNSLSGTAKTANSIQEHLNILRDNPDLLNSIIEKVQKKDALKDGRLVIDDSYLSKSIAMLLQQSNIPSTNLDGSQNHATPSASNTTYSQAIENSGRSLAASQGSSNYHPTKRKENSGKGGSFKAVKSSMNKLRVQASKTAASRESNFKAHAHKDI